MATNKQPSAITQRVMQLAASRPPLTNNLEDDFLRIEARIDMIESKATKLTENLMAQVANKYDERFAALEQSGN